MAPSGFDTKTNQGVIVSVDQVASEDDLSNDQHAPEPRVGPNRVSALIRDWTAAALLLSYFVFSISFYTVLDNEATKIFWFLYLTIATIVAGTTALEAYDGLTPLREARKATSKSGKDGFKFNANDDALPPLELIFDLSAEEKHDGSLQSLRRLRQSLIYPSHKVRVHVLCLEYSTAHTIACDYDESLERSGVRIHAIPASSFSSLPGRIACFLSRVPLQSSAIIGIFAGDQRPHPHAPHRAAERLSQDTTIDVLQGRNISVPSASPPSVFATAAILEHDMVHALLQPGRAVSWGLSVASSTNAYWRAATLAKAASVTATVPRDGLDLGYTAVGQNACNVYDLALTAYEPCSTSFPQYWSSRTQMARLKALATVRYTSLAFKRHKIMDSKDSMTPSKWTLKTRYAVFYTLPVLQITSHAILQYFCMALAFLFTATPTSTVDFALTICFPYPVSEWFIIGGLVCLTSTVFMIYKARSEFVPLWTAPIFLALYPVLLASRAGVDLYAQLDVIVR